MPKEETKQIIEAAAFKVFLQKGYANTSMSELVKVAGVSKGAFYHYFDSKEHLYFSVLDSYFLKYFKEADWSNTKGLSPEELAQSIDTTYHQFFDDLLRLTENRIARYYIMFFEAFELHPSFKKEVQAFYLTLQKVIDDTCNEHGVPPNGIEVIRKYEGFMFWQAVFPRDNQLKK